jgi:hypothetical protein
MRGRINESRRSEARFHRRRLFQGETVIKDFASASLGGVARPVSLRRERMSVERAQRRGRHSRRLMRGKRTPFDGKIAGQSIPRRIAMSSNLSGLDRQLAWSEYPTKRGAAPSAGQSRTAAMTFSGMQSSAVRFANRGGHFELVDDVRVSITFDGRQSWVMSWALTEATPFPTDLLNHEQGHYTITALIARDFFTDVMLLKDQTFPTANAGNAAVAKIRNNTLNKLRAVQDLYDAEVHPEQDSGQSRGPKQKAWDGFFETASLKYRPFLIPQSEWESSHGNSETTRELVAFRRPEPMHIDFKRVGADYLPVCERLIDVLTAAGKTI